MSTAVDLSAGGGSNGCSSTEVEFAPSPQSSLVLVCEVIVGFGLLEAVLWTAGDLRSGLSVAAGVWIIGTILYRRQSVSELGLGCTRMLRSLWVIPVAAVLGGVILLIGSVAGTLHPYVLKRGLFLTAFGYPFWTLQQEFMLQSFFFNRLERVLGSGKAVWAAAGLFALAHLPNPLLVVATMIGGVAFCEVFRRYRNIYTPAVAQAILGICLAAAAPDTLHHHMRVGIAYLTFH
jgi:membrane protease YdiL (CAAX protease family)